MLEADVLPEELHEPALHLEPDVARDVEEERQEGQVERNPLGRRRYGLVWCIFSIGNIYIWARSI
jgi:hypothetical protein